MEFERKDDVTRSEFSLEVTSLRLLISDTNRKTRITGFGHARWRQQFSAIRCKAENHISVSFLKRR